jgi:alpha-D-xyloside xylohydrolase
MKKITLFFISVICGTGMLHTSSLLAAQKRPVIFTIGDSTMAPKDTADNPERGWAMALPLFFDTTEVAFENHARNGRSTKSFIDEGRWQAVADALKAGDYVFIQFGHNDQKADKPAVYAPAEGAYSENIKRFVEETRQKGAFPVLMTPIVRRKFDENGVLLQTHGNYPDVVRSLAKTLKVPMIDMEAKSRQAIQALGAQKSKDLFVWFGQGVHRRFPEGKQDDTHLNLQGAKTIAALAVEGIFQENLPLKKMVKRTTLPDMALWKRTFVLGAETPVYGKNADFGYDLNTRQADEKTSLGIKSKAQSMDVEIQFFTPNIVRVFRTPENKPYQKNSLSVVKIPEKTDFQITKTNGIISLKSSILQVDFNPGNGQISFYDLTGKRLFTEKPYGTQFTPICDAGKPSFTIRQEYLLEKDEPIYGVGQIMDGKLNRRNSAHHLQNENMSTFSPYFMSPTKGYAVFWDNYSVSDFLDTPQGLEYSALGHCADYYFMFGGSPDGVISCVRDLTGKAPMLPLWAYGFFQSKERYQTQEEGLNVLKKFRELQVPIDCIIQDWRYWAEYNKTDSAWNSQSFDPERFSNPKAWADEIHKLNAKLLIVTWPGFGPKTEQRQEFDAKKMIVNFDTWPPNSGARPYDVFNPEARDIYWKYLDKGIFSYIHNDGWWLDSTEPDHINRKESDYDLTTHSGSYRSVKNAYSMMHNSGIALHQKAQTKNKRVVILTRSGFIGQQRFGSNTWSGDVRSSWDMLARQIPAALNFTMMGIPNWNSDIGGFFAGDWNNGGGAKNPEFQELYVRWMQFGAFCPMMRSHGTDIPREIWNFGKRGEWAFDAQEKMINLRYRLLPYIYSTSFDVSQNDGTFMRPLVMDFPADKNVYDLGSEYLFGRSVLVAPVTKPGVAEWPIYLPEGADWWDFWTNEPKSGGQTTNRSVTKDILPLYIKAGNILPFGPQVQYSTEKRWDNLEIRIYPGADGEFTLYEDENDNYNYEKGQYSTIKFHWNDKDKTLTIDEREGSFNGMLKSRKFRIVLVSANKGLGDKDTTKADKTISYNGKKMNVKL